MGRRNWRYRQTGGQKKPAIFYNRRHPDSNWVSIGDIVLNAKEWLYGFFHHVPSGSRMLWRGDKIVGHITRHRN